MKVIHSRFLLCFMLAISLPCTVIADPITLKWGATSPHSGLYTNTRAIQDIVNTECAGKISITVVDSEGFADNLTGIGKKSIDFGPASILDAHAAYKGERDYSGKPIASLRSLWGGYKTPIHIITSKQSEVTSIGQLNDVPFAMNQATTSGKLLDLFFKAQGVQPNYKDMAIGSSGDAIESAIVQGWFKAGYKDKAIEELERIMDLNILPVTQAMIDKMNSQYSGYGMLMTIPNGLYTAITQEQKSFAYVVSDFAHKGIDKEVVYKIVKAVWENKHQLTNSRLTLKKGDFDKMLQMAIDFNPGVPFHPGALKFYREQTDVAIPSKLIPPEAIATE